MHGIDSTPFPCPCCGFQILDRPALNALCPICLWEDDPVQLRWPDWPGGANTLSLIAAQHAYAHTGACGSGALPYVRVPTADDQRDPGWCPIRPYVDDFEPRGEQHADWPDDPTTLYWWRPTFWRRHSTNQPT
ncbi:MAG: CPCC family cysteine-rich protein [Nocardioidaceae bacterium]